ncbi:CapA family protein [Streptomyces indicus]|uniref:Poly-gamma-glutamate synthesis protein (Capsule biosynthesis protein) n=1 Tax=Streptomyces indicus TaxID=417292 RepID=A0A1G8U0I1_9ACTN|nr:CapA family protein [Streptomyces indicus]SDJ46530.1 poly-gamma-glutamate synthesis protein (capsule biosynthesis protein) [Streptomyces indicus]
MTERTGSFRARSTGAVLAAVLTATAAAGCSEGQPAPAPGPASEKKPPAPSAAGGPAPAPAPAEGFTLVASGDVLPHASIIRQANADAGGDGYDFRPMLAGVKPVVAKADLAICHMETVYGADGDYTGYPAFKSPPQVADGLAATGYDSCSTASNHTLDAGAAGIRRTLDALDKAGIAHAGSARSAAEAKRPTILKAGGAKVAHLAYSYGTNGYPLPKGQPWALNLIDEKKIIADARAARRAGADVVVVSPHWGTEWQDQPDARQLRLAKRLTAAQTRGRPDIDLIIGTHAHVPQPYEKVNGTWVIYGMGDQIAGDMINYSGSHDPRGNQGTIGRFTFAPPKGQGDRWQVTKAEFIPQWFDTGDGRVVNLNAAIKRGADFTDVRDRIRRISLSRGAAEDGLLMGS